MSIPFWIDVEDRYGNKLGYGPLETAAAWRHTRRLDAIGEFSFTMAAGDPQRSLVRALRVVRCWTMANGRLLEIGNGVIDRIEYTTGGDQLQVGGSDLLVELARADVGDLGLYEERAEHPARVTQTWYDSGYHAEYDLDAAVDLAVGDTTTWAEAVLGQKVLDTAYNYLEIRSPYQFHSIAFVLHSTLPAEASLGPVELMLQYWSTDVDDWVDGSITSDGMSVQVIGGYDGGSDPWQTFCQSGTVVFSPPSDWGVASGDSNYKVRISPHFTLRQDQLTRPVDIADIAITHRRPTLTALADIMWYAPPGWSLDPLEGYTSTASATELGSELVTNGDFEDYTGTLDDGVTDTFASTTNHDTGAGDLIEATTTMHGGAAALKITRTTNMPYLEIGITVAAGKDYQITVWTRGDGAVDGGLRLYDAITGDAITPAVYSGVTGTTYTAFSYQFTTPVGCTAVTVYLLGPRAAGAVYFDDVSVKARVGGEVYLESVPGTVFEALARVAEQTGEHFILSYTGGRRVLWLRDDRRLAAMRATNTVDPAQAADYPELCLVRNLRESQQFSAELCSRVLPFGGGEGADRVTLADCTRTAPTGYVLDTANNYLERTAAESAYEQAIVRRIEATHINALDRTARQRQYASNQLFDWAYQYLQRHSATDLDPLTGDIPRSISLEVVKADRMIWPGHLLTLDYRLYRESTNYLDLLYTGDNGLWILATTQAVDASGLRLVAIETATIDGRPSNADEMALAREIRALRTARAQTTAHRRLTAQSAGAVTHLVVEDGRVTAMGGAQSGLSGSYGGFVMASGVVVAELAALICPAVGLLYDASGNPLYAA